MTLVIGCTLISLIPCLYRRRKKQELSEEGIQHFLPLNNFVMFRFEKYYLDQATIYPGCYTPVNDSGKNWERLLKNAKAKAINPPVHITKLSDHYRIQLFMPGFSREELMIHTQDHLISIVGVRIPHTKTQAENREVDSSNHIYVREMRLPDDVDTEFASANYNDNILSIYLFKANLPVKNGSANIPVY